ncbi:hypothetical protein C5B94_01870, partial [Clavibacter michiganensis]
MGVMVCSSAKVGGREGACGRRRDSRRPEPAGSIVRHADPERVLVRLRPHGRALTLPVLLLLAIC